MTLKNPPPPPPMPPMPPPPMPPMPPPPKPPPPPPNWANGTPANAAGNAIRIFFLVLLVKITVPFSEFIGMNFTSMSPLSIAWNISTVTTSSVEFSDLSAAITAVATTPSMATQPTHRPNMCHFIRRMLL
ncbi:hypothetical protein DTL21_18660 [Bremerella cremea]|uniref:Uncharacterized protein n=1 Tax=Blastopirellula marina TaxID=124 RepID=A0A2S8FJM9_9BACT|nr:hypothetical protein C5Y83_18645 [Blastopirellula marina]RCS45316.1 hypothetical protein DTL21_18660 [Bremerella cremea]